MSLRDSLDLIRAVRPEAGHAALESEIQQERASSLAAAERKVKEALALWRAAAESERAEPLKAARYAVWAYFVQRELIGFRRHADVIRDLDIPATVLNGLGETPQPWYRRRR
ncbi:MAG: DUF6665 family protein [Devosia sp.]